MSSAYRCICCNADIDSDTYHRHQGCCSSFCEGQFGIKPPENEKGDEDLVESQVDNDIPEDYTEDEEPNPSDLKRIEDNLSLLDNDDDEDV